MIKLLQQINELLKNRKSYLLATVMIVLAILEMLGKFTMPEWGWLALSGLGLGFMRAAITKITEALKSVPDDSK